MKRVTVGICSLFAMLLGAGPMAQAPNRVFIVGLLAGGALAPDRRKRGRGAQPRRPKMNLRFKARCAHANRKNAAKARSSMVRAGRS